MPESKSQRHWVQQLNLAHFEPTSPAMPYWLPAGMVVMRELRAMWLREHLACGYVEMSGPQLSDESVFALSGHAMHYRDGMFWADRFGLKPMNCPGAMLIFASRRRSYRELPLRLYCEDLLHRNEPSGALNGILRVQEFRQDDAHVFITDAEIREELESIFHLAEKLYARFGLTFRLRLGTAPADRMGRGRGVEPSDRRASRCTRPLCREGCLRGGAGRGFLLCAQDRPTYEGLARREWQTAPCNSICSSRIVSGAVTSTRPASRRSRRSSTVPLQAHSSGSWGSSWDILTVISRRRWLRSRCFSLR